MLETVSSLSPRLSDLQRSLTCLGNAWGYNGGKQSEVRSNVLPSDEDQNRDLLNGYLETRNRVYGQLVFTGNSNCADEQKRREERKLEKDNSDENMLFYELALDERTRPICDLYGMMSNLMLQLESAVAAALGCQERLAESPSGDPQNSQDLREYQRGLEYMTLYVKSFWSIFLPRKRRALFQRAQNVTQLLSGERVECLNWDVDDLVTVTSPTSWLFHDTQPEVQSHDQPIPAISESSFGSSIPDVTESDVADDQERVPAVSLSCATTDLGVPTAPTTHDNASLLPAAATETETTRLEPTATVHSSPLLRLSQRVGREDLERAIEECPANLGDAAATEAELFPSFDVEEVQAETDICELAGEQRPSDNMSDSCAALGHPSNRRNRSEKTVSFHASVHPTAFQRRQNSSALRRRIEPTGDEKEEQDSLTTSIGETANRLRVLAYQSRDIIIKDKQRLLETSTVQDNYLHETEKSWSVSKQLAWTGSFSFLQELAMVAIAVGLFLILASFIASTILIA